MQTLTLFLGFFLLAIQMLLCSEAWRDDVNGHNSMWELLLLSTECTEIALKAQSFKLMKIEDALKSFTRTIHTTNILFSWTILWNVMSLMLLLLLSFYFEIFDLSRKLDRMTRPLINLWMTWKIYLFIFVYKRSTTR